MARNAGPTGKKTGKTPAEKPAARRAPRKTSAAKTSAAAAEASAVESVKAEAAAVASGAARAAAAKAASAETKAKAEKPQAAKPSRTAGPPPKSLADAMTEAAMAPEDFVALSENMVKVFDRGAQVWAKSVASQAADTRPVHFDPFNTMGAFTELWRNMMSHPGELADATLRYWTEQGEIWRRAALRSVGAPGEPVVSPARGDKRFADPEWSENVVFDVLKQSYLAASNYLMSAAETGRELSERDQRKVAFFTRQFVEALSPSNFFATNPEVLRTTAEQRGENLVRGLDHVLEDLERGRGQLLIRQTDLEKFKVGENMAVTPGEVIFRNDVMELIQYAPVTETVAARPLLICPPWINKFYILDLNEKKSLVKWLTEQGRTVFMISWVNPDQRHAEKTFVDYMAEGLFEGIGHALAETQADKLHLASYCIGGTMAASALTYLAQNPEHPLASRLASATFFTAQTEFSNAGELQIFVDDEQLAMLDEQMLGGVLGAEKMAASFNMLRASDLIWSFVTNNYLLGKEPFPFDLLYWNSDSTRMPAQTHRYYLEKFYRDDALAKGALQIGETVLDLSQLSLPSYHVSTVEDHIAPAASVYRGVRLMGGKRRFVLAGSGHIAGVVNPPAAGKYQHWVREDGALPDTVEAWRAGAEERPGSWWGDWSAFMTAHDGGLAPIPALQPAQRHPSLCPAPGEYVRSRYDGPNG